MSNTNEERNKTRVNVIERLDYIIDEIAYSGLSSWEYEAIKTTRRFIKLCLDRDTNERNNNG